jgi:hypothetical protein
LWPAGSANRHEAGWRRDAGINPERASPQVESLWNYPAAAPPGKQHDQCNAGAQPNHSLNRDGHFPFSFRLGSIDGDLRMA